MNSVLLRVFKSARMVFCCGLLLIALAGCPRPSGLWTGQAAFFTLERGPAAEHRTGSGPAGVYAFMDCSTLNFALNSDGTLYVPLSRFRPVNRFAWSNDSFSDPKEFEGSVKREGDVWVGSGSSNCGEWSVAWTATELTLDEWVSSFFGFKEGALQDFTTDSETRCTVPKELLDALCKDGRASLSPMDDGSVQVSIYFAGQ